MKTIFLSLSAALCLSACAVEPERANVTAAAAPQVPISQSSVPEIAGSYALLVDARRLNTRAETSRDCWGKEYEIQGEQPFTDAALATFDARLGAVTVVEDRAQADSGEYDGVIFIKITSNKTTTKPLPNGLFKAPNLSSKTSIRSELYFSARGEAVYSSSQSATGLYNEKAPDLCEAVGPAISSSARDASTKTLKALIDGVTSDPAVQALGARLKGS